MAKFKTITKLTFDIINKDNNDNKVNSTDKVKSNNKVNSINKVGIKQKAKNCPKYLHSCSF